MTSAPPCSSSASAAAAFLLLLFAIGTSTDHQLLTAADTAISAECDAHMIPQGSPFWGHLGSLLALLVDETPYTPSFYFKTRYGGGDAPAFGEAHCSSSVSATACHACLKRLSNDIWAICNCALGAHVEYANCGIRYDCDYF